MRTSSSVIFSQLSRSIMANMEEYARLNAQLSTGKKIGRPSDDVAGMVRAIGYRLSIGGNEQYQRNITEAGIQLNFADKIVGSVSDTLQRLKSLASADGIALPNRQAYATEARAFRDQLLDLANSKLGNRYIFSGYKSDTNAFQYNSATGHYDYMGDNGEKRIPIGAEIDVATGAPASEVFSVALTGTPPVSLPDGTPISYTQSTDPVTGIASVTVEIGTSGDPGYDTFTFSNSIDMANILASAWEYKDVDGSDLNADPEISEEMALKRIAALSKPLEDATTQALSVQAELGTRQVLLKGQNERLKGENLSLENALGKTEDADMDETVIEMLRVQTALEAMREAASRLMSQSLMDFLR